MPTEWQQPKSQRAPLQQEENTNTSNTNISLPLFKTTTQPLPCLLHQLPPLEMKFPSMVHNHPAPTINDFTARFGFGTKIWRFWHPFQFLEILYFLSETTPGKSNMDPENAPFWGKKRRDIYKAPIFGVQTVSFGEDIYIYIPVLSTRFVDWYIWLRFAVSHVWLRPSWQLIEFQGAPPKMQFAHEMKPMTKTTSKCFFHRIHDSITASFL